jgi:hypothetical protein
MNLSGRSSGLRRSVRRDAFPGVFRQSRGDTRAAGLGTFSSSARGSARNPAPEQLPPARGQLGSCFPPAFEV